MAPQPAPKTDYARLQQEEIERIAEIVRDNILFAAGMSFAEEVRFVVACHIVEHYGGTDEQQESLREDHET